MTDKLIHTEICIIVSFLFGRKISCLKSKGILISSIGKQYLFSAYFLSYFESYVCIEQYWPCPKKRHADTPPEVANFFSQKIHNILKRMEK